MYRDERVILKARLQELEGERSWLESRRKQLEREIDRREGVLAGARRWVRLSRLFTVAAVIVLGLLGWRAYAPARLHVDQREARRTELSRAQSEAERRYALARDKANKLLAPLQKPPAEDAHKTRIFGEIRFHDALNPEHAQLILGAAACALGDDAVARRAHQALVQSTEEDPEPAAEKSAERPEPGDSSLAALLERLCADKVRLP
jgi:hypothetical protein